MKKDVIAYITLVIMVFGVGAGMGFNFREVGEITVSQCRGVPEGLLQVNARNEYVVLNNLDLNSTLICKLEEKR